MGSVGAASSGTTLFLMTPDETQWGELLSILLLLSLGGISKHLAHLSRYGSITITLLISFG